MNKKILFTLLVLSLLAVMSCSSTPEPEEEVTEEAVPEEVVEEVVEEGQTQVEAALPEATPEETPEEPAVEPVSKEEFAIARQALERAEMVEGSRFAPDLMAQAYEDLKMAASLGESDPEQARLLLAGVVEKGDRAFELGKTGLKKEAHAYLDKLQASLLDIEADKFSPVPYDEVIQQFSYTRASIDAERLDQARKDMDKSDLMAKNLYNILDQNIRWIAILERDTKAYLNDAEKEEAYLWAGEEFNRASYLLDEGMLRFRKYDVEGSEASLKEAKFRAKDTLYLTRVRKKEAETDARLMSVQTELEDASTLTVQTEDGDIMEADPWSGADYLSSNPLLQSSSEDYEEEDSELTDYDLEREIAEEEEEELVAVSGMLEKAKTLWQQAIDERNAGNHDKARELLTQAEAYIRAYRANAVGKTYIVKYREKNTDCLWRIAEFEEIYGDPFLWPKIWQRNQKMIPNPDLIYPGQKLIIPPVE